MSKIRINELARELEVKPNVIIDLLRELGVADKKTHSSSLDDDVALEVRRRVAESSGVGGNGAGSSTPQAPHDAPAVIEHATPAPSRGQSAGKAAPAVAEAPRHETPHEIQRPEAAKEVPDENAAPAAKPHPLRPPLSATSGLPVAPPIARGAPIPARPVPTPRPGQILSGPRQPLPPGVSDLPKAPPSMAIPSAAQPGQPRPAAPLASPVPSIPTPRAAPRQPEPSAPAQPAIQHPVGGGGPLRPPAKPNLAGQPAARPIVPPRPDMVARLAKPPGAPAPAMPRPGMPTTRPASPVPGRPIYTGPVRPGQPLMRGPGGPSTGPAGPGMRGRGRPMHPTSPLRAEPATLPTDTGRRHATKPGTRDRRREVDHEEGRLRPMSRRSEAFEPPPIDREITIAEGITVRELSEKLGIKATLVVKRLMEKKILATINQTLDVKLADELARDFGASTNKVSYEEESTHEVQQAEVEQDRERRPPVVTIMGHVDHGKTSLLDASVRRMSPTTKPAALRSTSVRITSIGTAARSCSLTRPAMKRSPVCARAAPRSPISWCLSWRPTTA